MPTLPQPIDATANFSVAGGRVTTLQAEDHENVESIRIVGGPDHGNLTVNPDNTMALVMSHDPGFSGQIEFSFEVTYADGTTELQESTVNVETSTQQAGWGQGNFYMLEEDENGDIIVEHGQNHREVYVSGSDDALGLADIAAREGISVDDITQDWLASHEEYGSSPEMALDSAAGMRLWYGITGDDSEPSSNWLLFERGYEYDDIGRVVDRGTMGEDPLHPIHITSYGEGAKPVLNTNVFLIQESNENIVFSDVAITEGLSALSGKNLLLDNVDISNNVNGEFGLGVNISGLDGFTLHNSSITDVYRTEPDNPDAEYWSNVMTSGIHIGDATGILIEGSLFDHNGWAPDYQYDMSTDGGLPPTMFNHNIYISETVTDFTLRDNIIMQGASYGVKAIPGGFIEDNVLLDNNNAATLLGGVPTDDDDIRTGNFTLAVDNLITSAGYKLTNHGNLGAVSRGIDNAGMDTTFIGNIITHLADPDNPLEQDYKEGAQRPLYHGQDVPYYDDTIIYNWAGSEYAEPDQNTGGLNPGVLDVTTIQRFTQQLLGDPDAGIPDLAAYLRAQATGGELDHYVDADLIIKFFQAGFGFEVDGRILAETLRFVPNDLGDGIRWDNRLNWTTDDLPGSVEGDSVDLGGNWVNYGGTTRIDDLDFGAGGELTVTQGYLEVEDELAVGAGGGELLIDGAGQFWTDGYADRQELTIDVAGGRFANTGVFKGRVDMTVSDDGQAILATDGATFDLSAGSRLEIIGRDTRVGFDGEGSKMGLLRLDDESTLAFTAEDGMGRIREFHSGRFGEGRPGDEVVSGANLGDARLEIDITDLPGGASERVLMRVDELIGSFGELDVIGLGANRDATVVIDYETDTVVLRLGAAGRGTGLTDIRTLNDDMETTRVPQDLWDALTAGQGVLADDPITSDEDEEDLAEVFA